jgi:hypothetical protein
VFAPELVLPTLRKLLARGAVPTDRFARASGYNDTVRVGAAKAQNATSPGAPGWISEGNFGLDQGMIVLMAENYRSGLPWRLLRDSAPIRTGLHRAGFRGGWLDEGAL